MIELPVNIFNLIIFASIIIGVTFGLLLILVKRINCKGNRFLGCIPIIIALWNCWVLGIDFKLYESFLSLNLIPFQYSLALGPCIFYYTKYITDQSFNFKKKYLFHFVPVCVEVIVSIVQGLESIEKGIPNYDTTVFFMFNPVLQLGSIISVVIYSFYTLKVIRNYHIWINNNYSNSHGYNLNWLYRLIRILTILWLLWVPYTIVDYIIFDYDLGVRHYYPLYILMAIITIWISAEGFLRPEVILLDSLRKSLRKDIVCSDEIIKQAKWLKEQMEANLFYLNSELTLGILAKELNLHPNNVSRIINEGLKKSFSDFVNEYRIDAVIQKLGDAEYNKITLLGVAFDCGFNSKTTFNRVFKKAMGKTPLEYKEELKRI